jgi:hypothetical protein
VQHKQPQNQVRTKALEAGKGIVILQVVQHKQQQSQQQVRERSLEAGKRVRAPAELAEEVEAFRKVHNMSSNSSRRSNSSSSRRSSSSNSWVKMRVAEHLGRAVMVKLAKMVWQLSKRCRHCHHQQMQQQRWRWQMLMPH